MTVLAQKLSGLTDTIALVGTHGAADLGDAMVHGHGSIAVAIGSGGSGVAAAYFAHCRTTLGLGATRVLTPMQFLLSLEDWTGVDIWLFSAGVDDPDFLAASRCAVSSCSDSVRLIAVRAEGATARAALRHPASDLFVLPVADPEDAVFATHATIAMVTALLIASDGITERPHGPRLLDVLRSRTRAALTDDVDAMVGAFRRGDTIIVAHDPQLMPIAMLLEDAFWAAGIAPVQRTDFRALARDRDMWAARGADGIFVLTLTTVESEAVWLSVAAAIPHPVRRGAIAFGNGGRLANAVGIVKGFAVIARLGELTGIDTAPLGGHAIAVTTDDDAALLSLLDGLTPAVRHKAAARALHDPPDEADVSFRVAGWERLHDLGEARFVGIVLDYDGTVVANEPVAVRLGPPSPAVMAELVRLVDCGVRVGFATGRGGTAGDRLREALPARIHDRVLIGYYNGAHLRPLDIDIRLDRPGGEASVAAVADWIRQSDLLLNANFLAGPVQVTITHAQLRDVASFAGRLSACPEIAEGRACVLRSHHSFDIVAAGTSKLVVVRALAGEDGAGLVLCVGDSGSPLGNDRELLSGPHGVSVGSVCGSHQGAWPLFGSRLRGPDALWRLLRAARVAEGSMRIDVTRLDPD